MFTRTKTLTYKTYDELTPQEQQRVLDKYRYIDVEYFDHEHAQWIFEHNEETEAEYGLSFWTVDTYNFNPRYRHIVFNGLDVLYEQLAVYFHQQWWQPYLKTRSQSRKTWQRYHSTHRAIRNRQIDVRFDRVQLSWSVSKNTATVTPAYGSEPDAHDPVDYDLIEQCIDQAIQEHADYYLGALQDQYEYLISDAYLEERFSDSSLYFETESLEFEYVTSE